MHRIVIFISVASIVAAVAQQDVPRFKSGVDVVQFTVTVLDKDRHPVTGLTASDFDVLVDGKPRLLAAFAAVTLPGEPSMGAAAASIPPVAPDVLTNQLPPEGRLIVIVMDRSIPDGQPMQAAHAIANAAIDRLGPNDLGAVVYTGAVSRKYAQGITVDRARLHAAAKLTTFGAVQEPPAPPSLTAAIASRGAPQQSQQVDRVQLASEELSGECICGVCVIDSLTALAKALTGAMGRQKSILFVGSDIAMASRTNGSTCEARIHSARERLSRALDEANLTFNVVDPRGLEPLGESAESGGPVGNVDRIKNLFREQSLAVLPDYTGGRVVLNNNKPETAIGPLFDESRSYYVLAVARDPAASKEDDRHRIKITVKRREVIVHARNVYFAADPKAEAKRAPNAAAGALNELLPGGDFSLQMNLVPQFTRDGSTEIHVLLGVDSAVAGKLDVLIRAYDRVFTPVDTPLKQQLDVPPSAVAGSAAFQWASVLKPAPGDYEVRAAVATADGKHAANVIGYVDVPDVAKQGLALSGIVVKSGGGPTVQRDFGAGAAIGLSFQVASAKKAMGAALVRYVLRNDLGQAVANIEVPHERATTIAPRVEGYDIGVRLPALAGRYVATLEATDGHVTVQRQVLFTVR
jgi:VWFA-related protein